MALTVLIAPSGFKEGLSARAVAEAMAAGVRTAMPASRILMAPMVDGEGFTEALVAATGGVLRQVDVTGPLGEPLLAPFGLLGGPGPLTAVIEVAAAAGLRLVPADRRDPTLTTSYGLGELIRAALDAGAARILIGCGDSGVNDGGAGLAQALGVRLLDEAGAPIGRGGMALSRLARIDLSGRDPRLDRVNIEAAVNTHNILLGPFGVSRVYGRQKGATDAQIERLDAALTRYAACIRTACGLDVAALAGAGASGGIGAGLVGLLGARLRPRFELIARFNDFDALLGEADLVLTAEGMLDGQTPFGKVPSEVARRASAHGIPVVALAGTLGDGVMANLNCGIDAFLSIQAGPCTLDDAMADAAGLIRRAAADAMRMIGVGMRVQPLAGADAGLLLADGFVPRASRVDPNGIDFADLDVRRRL